MKSLINLYRYLEGYNATLGAEEYIALVVVSYGLVILIHKLIVLLWIIF